MAAKKPPAKIHIQTRAQAAADDKKTPGKHKPYSVAEARREAIWKKINQNKPK